MAEEPQPPSNPPQPTAAEQNQEAAALSNLNTTTLSEDQDSSSTPSKAADHAALGAALSHLSVSEDKSKASGSTKKVNAGSEERRKKAAELKKVKVNEVDVKWIVEELEVSKKRATEMLQVSGGDRMGAVRDFVVPSVKAA